MKMIRPTWALNMIGVQVGTRTVNEAASEVLFLEAGEMHLRNTFPCSSERKSYI